MASPSSLNLRQTLKTSCPAIVNKYLAFLYVWHIAYSNGFIKISENILTGYSADGFADKPIFET
jgi:hypothetical protein